MRRKRPGPGEVVPLANTTAFRGCKPSPGIVLGPTVMGTDSGGTLRSRHHRLTHPGGWVIGRPRAVVRAAFGSPPLARFSRGKRCRICDGDHYGANRQTVPPVDT